MSEIWTASKLALFIAFVVPGFISLKTYELLVPRTLKKSTQQLIDAIAYSSINYALLLWPIYEVETLSVRELHPHLYAAFYVVVILVAPIIWAYVLRVLRTTQFLQRTLPHPTGKPWDYVFAQRKRYWIVVTLKDGKRIGGRYDSQSFASDASDAEQLYLEEAWELNSDGGFERPRTDSAGVIILGPGIVSVEFFNLIDGDENERQEANQQGLPS